MNPYKHAGMSTWMDQERDRAAWRKSVAYRKQLISELHKRGVQLSKPKTRKIKQLEELLQVVKRYETSPKTDTTTKRRA